MMCSYALQHFDGCTQEEIKRLKEIKLRAINLTIPYWIDQGMVSMSCRYTSSVDERNNFYSADQVLFAELKGKRRNHGN